LPTDSISVITMDVLTFKDDSPVRTPKNSDAVVFADHSVAHTASCHRYRAAADLDTEDLLHHGFTSHPSLDHRREELGNFGADGVDQAVDD
jgi:hypothetical protein